MPLNLTDNLRATAQKMEQYLRVTSTAQVISCFLLAALLIPRK